MLEDLTAGERAALARYREYLTDMKPHGLVYDDAEDTALLAALAVRLTPPDDLEPVSVEWLIDAYGPLQPLAMKRLTYSLGGVFVSPPCGHLGWHWTLGATVLPAPLTRGAVRRLLAALGWKGK